MDIIKCSEYIIASSAVEGDNLEQLIQDLRLYEGFSPYSPQASINEAINVQVLDCLIDGEGNLYNGKNSRAVRKGNIERNTVRITAIIGPKDDSGSVATDSRGYGLYPAGLDKNGKLVCVYQNDGVVLGLDKNPLPMAEPLKAQFGDFWRTDADYYSLVPIAPTGWVNFKLDMELCKRVRRYSKNLSKKTGNKHGIFIDKLTELSRISVGQGPKVRATKNIQRELSAIMLLHQLNELKNFFTPSSAGFLFESFICGLLPSAIVNDDNGFADVHADGLNYQIKLYGETGQLKLGKNHGIVDHFIIAIKHPTSISVYVLGQDGEMPNCYLNFAKANDDGTMRISPTDLRKLKDRSFVYELELYDLDEKIKRISKGLKDSLEQLYAGLSKFQYNIETITTGVDENGELIDATFKSYSDGARKNLEQMKSELNTLLGQMKLSDLMEK